MPPGACGRPRGRNTEARNALTDGRKRHSGIFTFGYRILMYDNKSNLKTSKQG